MYVERERERYKASRWRGCGVYALYRNRGESLMMMMNSFGG
jgi:hypothetical protein